jgi:uncharacterized cupredoxin-like copper-binding protein
MTAPTSLHPMTGTPLPAPPRQVRPLRRLLVAVTVTAVLVLAGYALDAARATPVADDILGPGEVTVVMDMRYSRFSVEHLRVYAGTLVRFEVHNLDPIHHELVVGPPEVHAAHEQGTHLDHPPVPGEVSLGPGASGMTYWVFDEPGEVTFACHLPGHVDYGMVGTVEVVAP